MIARLAIAVFLTVAVGGCGIDDARAAAQSHDAGVETADETSLLGLTAEQVKARRGAPTKQTRREWVYTPEQEGCREVIVSEVLKFKRGKVASVTLRRRQTNKRCDHRVWRSMR